MAYAPSLEQSAVPLTKASHVSGDYYASKQQADYEKQQFFMAEWLFMSREEEYPEFGSYRTFKVAGEPIVICRDKEMKMHAFLNACAHRGVEVTQGEGSKKRFVCPYHAWSYSLDGQLVAATHMDAAEGFDMTACHLDELHLVVWEKCIFVSFSTNPPDFEEFIADFAHDHQVVSLGGSLELGASYSFEFSCNWKLALENFADLYHVGTLHKATIGRNFSEAAVEWQPRRNGGYFVTYDAGPGLGEMVFGKNQAMSNLPDNWSSTTYLSPNLQVFVRTDAVRMVTTWPISPDTVHVQHHDLFPTGFRTWPDYEKRIARHVELVSNTLNEDREMVASLQRIQSSRQWLPGRMSGMEGLVHRIVGHLGGREQVMSPQARVY